MLDTQPPTQAVLQPVPATGLSAGCAYRVCTRCVMDTSDPEIVFDGAGVCNHCTRALAWLAARPPLAERAAQLDRLVADIKERGRGKPYDCLIGVSGGVDSTFVAWKVKDLGLRPLAVHLDNGWDSELAVSNIEQVLKRLGIDLVTVVLDWDEFRDLQVAFLKASVPDAEVPSDHAIFASLFRVAAKHGIGWIINGTNRATEGILPTRWTYSWADWRYIKGIHRRFGRVPLRSFPHLSLKRKYFYMAARRIRQTTLLDYLDYHKEEAMALIQDRLGWRAYGGKHHESIYTRFFQSYILPRKFGIDKRRAHLSSLICSGQVTREDALRELAQPICPPELLEEDRVYAIKKLGLTEEEFGAIMALPLKTYRDYPGQYVLIDAMKRVNASAPGRTLLRAAKGAGVLPEGLM